ncbi:hypothetical protein D3C72_1887640 [compost metagenome]
MAVDDGVPLLVGHLLDDVVPGVAGVVDDDVDALEILDSRLDQALREIRGGHAAHARHRFAALRPDQFDDFVGRIGVQVVHHHARAF